MKLCLSQEYELAARCVDRVLQMEPNNYQAKQLKDLITKKIRRGAYTVGKEGCVCVCVCVRAHMHVFGHVRLWAMNCDLSIHICCSHTHTHTHRWSPWSECARGCGHDGWCVGSGCCDAGRDGHR